MKKEEHMNEDSSAHQQISDSCSSTGSEQNGQLGKSRNLH